MLYNVLKFEHLKIKDIMIPKEKMICMNIENSREKILQTIKKYKYTRIPVYAGKKDNIIGILNVKDILLKTLEENGELNLELKELIREPIFVAKKENIDEMFKTMQLNSKHIAIVRNEEGKVEGMLTMEDIIEKLMGNIIDEYDR